MAGEFSFAAAGKVRCQAMTVRAEEPEVLLDVVEEVAIDVIDLQGE